MDWCWNEVVKIMTRCILPAVGSRQGLLILHRSSVTSTSRNSFCCRFAREVRRISSTIGRSPMISLLLGNRTALRSASVNGYRLGVIGWNINPGIDKMPLSLKYQFDTCSTRSPCLRLSILALRRKPCTRGHRHAIRERSSRLCLRFVGSCCSRFGFPDITVVIWKPNFKDLDWLL